MSGKNAARLAAAARERLQENRYTATIGGKTYNDISYYGKKAIENGRLENFTPVTEDDKKIKEAYETERKKSWDSAIRTHMAETEEKKPKMRSMFEENRRQEQKTDIPLKISNGKDFGNVSRDAYMAIENNTLDSYKPINDSEKKALADYKKYMDTLYHEEEKEAKKDNKTRRTVAASKRPKNLVINEEETKQKKVISGYVPKILNLTKEQYNENKKNHPELPEFGSYEYFKRREELLRPEVKKIMTAAGADVERKISLAKNYETNPNWTKDEEVLAESKKYYEKFKYDNLIYDEYRDIHEQLTKFENETLYYSDSGEVDAKSGEAEARYAQERLDVLEWHMPQHSVGSTLTFEEKVDSLEGDVEQYDIEGTKEKAYKDYEKDKDKEYHNTFPGRVSANYTVSRIGIKSNNAGVISFAHTSDDIEASRVYQLLAERIQNRNKETFTNNNSFDETVAMFAQYAPQWIDQQKYNLLGRAIGAGIAFVSGLSVSEASKVGGNVAVAKYMYNQTAGSTYVRLLKESDLSAEDAKKLAESEATAAGIVEFGLGYLSDKLWSSIGNTKTGKIGAGGIKKTLSESASDTIVKNLVSIGITEKGAKTIVKVFKNVAKIAIDDFGEGVEEWMQTGMSKTADRYAEEGKTANTLELLWDSLDLSKYSSDDFKEMDKSFLAGVLIGFGSTGVNIGSIYTVNKTVSNIAENADAKRTGKLALKLNSEQLINDAVLAGKESKKRTIVKLANKVENAINEGRTVSAKDVGNLIKHMFGSEMTENESLDESTDIKGIFDKKIGTKANIASQDDVDRYVEYAYLYADETNKKGNIDFPKQKSGIIIAKADEKLIADLQGFTDIDLSDAYHVLRDNDIRHIKNSHGESTSEKYPITAEDQKKIPDIIKNYDDVLYVENGEKKGIFYVKRHNGVTYYLEAIRESGKILSNKQMIKVSTGTIPDIKGLREAINKKWNIDSGLNDDKVPQMYVQDVKNSYVPKNSITSNMNVVNNGGRGVSKNMQITGKRTQSVENTSVETVSVGDVFKDTKYGNTITVVERDDANTTIEIDTGKSTERKVLKNAQADTLISRGQYEFVERSEMSATETIEPRDENVTAQSEMPKVHVGDVYTAGDKTYTVTGRDNKNTTYTVTHKDGSEMIRQTGNNTADINFTNSDVYTRVHSGAEGNIIIKKDDVSFKYKSEAANDSGSLGETSSTNGISQDNDIVNNSIHTGNKNNTNANVEITPGLSKSKYNQLLSLSEKLSLDKLGKYLGVEIQIVDKIKNGAAEGEYINGVIRIAVDAENKFMVVAAHEMTHRMQELGAESYKTYRKAAVEMAAKESGKTVKELISDMQKLYLEHDVVLNKVEALDEIAANFAGRMFDNSKTMLDFFERLERGEICANLTSQERKGIIKRIIDFIKSFIEKFKGERFDSKIQGQISEMDRIVNLYEKTFAEATEIVARGTSTGENIKQIGATPKYNIEKSFEKKYDEWVNSGRADRKSLVVGKTSKALKSIGVKEQIITWDTSKINNSLKKHKYLNHNILKQIPALLENPIIVLQSKKFDSRITMFGEVYDGDGLPIMAVLELMPLKDKNGVVLDEIKIVSTHSRKMSEPTNMEQTQNIIDTSDILYIEPNKKRTDNWLMRTRLQLPFGITNYGPIKSITYPNGDVNTNSMQETGKNTPRYSIQKSFAEQVSETLQGKSSDRNHVYIGRTSSVLKQVGLNDLAMLITKGHLKDIHHEKVAGITKYHGLTEETINKLPYILDYPAIIFDSVSENNANAVCILSNITDSDGLPIIVAIKPDGVGRYNNVEISSNFVLSMYGKDDVQRFLNELGRKKENILFMDKKRTQEMLKAARLYLPAELSKLKFNNIIHQSKNIVNNNSMQNKKENTPKYMIKADNFGRKYWHVETDKDIFKNINDKKELQKAAFNYILRGDKGKIVNEIIDGNPLTFTRISAEEYVYGEAGKRLDANDYSKKMRIAPSITDLIKNANVDYNTPDHKNHSFAKDGFKNYRGRVRIDDVIFEYVVRVGMNNNKNMFYDINLEVESILPSTKVRQKYKSDPTSKNSITQQENGVKNEKSENPTKGSKYFIAGENSKKRRIKKLSIAMRLEENGVSREEIFKKTGWFRGAENRWKFEFSDKNYTFKRPNLITKEEKLRLDDMMERARNGSLKDAESFELLSLVMRDRRYDLEEIIEHDDLFKAYPQLRKMPVKFFFSYEKEGIASYDVNNKTIYVNREGTDESIKSSLLHEIQHAIQDIEEFALGASPEIWQSKIDEGFEKNSSKTGKTMNADELYFNTAGEIEARNAKERMYLSDEERREMVPDIGDDDTVFSQLLGRNYYLGDTDSKTNINAENIKNSRETLKNETRSGIIEENIYKENSEDEVYTRRNISENGTEHNQGKTESKTAGILQTRDRSYNSGRRVSRTKRGRHNLLEEREIQRIVETDRFKKLSSFVINEISYPKNKEIYKKYKNDNRWNEGCEFQDIITYDMLTDENNELRNFFEDNILEYFNSQIDVTTDTTGQTVPTDVLGKTKDSIVKNENGQLIPVYHGTNEEFEKFVLGDIGFHFGSYAQARQRAKNKNIDKPVFIKAYLNITNPLVIDEDFFGWNAFQIAQKLSHMSIITQEDGMSLLHKGKDSANKELVTLLKNKGYDGIVYTNEIEATNGKSYIVFDDEQIFRIENANASGGSDSKVKYSLKTGVQGKKYTENIKSNKKNSFKNGNSIEYNEDDLNVEFSSIVYNNGDEIELSEFEERRVAKAISTDGTYSGNVHGKIKYKYYGDYLYIYIDNGYDNYSFILKSGIEENWEFNNEITEVIRSAGQRSNKRLRFSDVRTQIRERIDARRGTGIENNGTVGYDDGISVGYDGQQYESNRGNDIEKNDEHNKGDDKSIKKKYSIKTGVPGKDMLQLLKEYGRIKTGEKPAREVNVPKKISKTKVVSRFARTMMEAGITPDTAISEFEERILDGTLTHEVITNQKASDWARNRIEKLGFEEALNEWNVASNLGKVGKKELALGMELYNQCITNKDINNAMKIAAELASEATRAGQTLQATRMLKLMSPDGKLYYLEKSIQKMNDEFRERIGDKYKDITLSEELMRGFLSETNEEKRNAIYDEICHDIADQIPATFLDKWNSWRYLAMLGNPRTHMRNIIGNAVFVPAIRIKNYVGAIIETAAGVDISERTKSFRKTKAAIDFAKKDFIEMEKVLKGENAKYAVTSDIEGKRTIFKTKWLENIRNKNFDFLEKEDMWFLKSHYVDALSRIITIRKLNVNSIEQTTLDTIRALAVKEAQAATYRDANDLAEALNKLQKKAEHSDKKAIRATSVLVEGVMPFKKTPLNIAKQGMNYSPVGILTGTYKTLKKIKDKKAYNTTEIIDDFAKGLTGTGLMLLGLFLAGLGMLSGADDENKKKREFDEMVGEQSYAIKIGNNTYTLDWMAPACLPLFIGVELYELTKDEISFADVVNATSTLTEPLLELSVFSGVNRVIETAEYSENQAVFAITSDMITSYFTQALPTVGGQLSRIIDKNKREYYYVDRNSNLPKGLQTMIGKAASKIPFASYLFEPSVDEWGREEEYGSFVERIFENTVSPGYYTNQSYTKVDKELKKLYERTGESSVLPTIQQKYYAKDNVYYYMTAKEYREVKKLRGKKSFELLKKLIESKRYGAMNDEEKIAAINKCYNQANKETTEKMFDKIKRKVK